MHRMKTTRAQTLNITCFCLLTALVCNVNSVHAQDILLEIEVEPNLRTLRLDGKMQDISLVAQSTRQDLAFKWTLQGPGNLLGDDESPGIFYLPPKTLDAGMPSQASVVLNVHDDRGSQASKKIIFQLLNAPEPLSPSEAEEPPPTPDRLSPSHSTPLVFHISCRYHPSHEKTFRPINEGSVLHSGDHYRIVFTPQQDAYVYIYQIDDSGLVFQLFPMDRFRGRPVNNFNPVQAGRDYYAPGKEMSFVLDELTGTERIYFLASRKQNRFLEERYEQLQKEPPSQQEALFHELLRQVMDQHGIEYTKPHDFDAIQDSLESLCQGCVYTLSFEHR
ncbi:hypothetical protein CSB45_02860 [candidate division KSB3 bacterium]|uniref:DUF4384 domain-containing protein n=1 Tax=candidate division KSB3 bacterium TaxID=2044937 RepID=A0A2G6E9P4_9BACT|nr:MAG: hypothetical protein CSB45_02860 [candidate division KSB3 bacterium]PIE29021.1 MAG: hypothetical protein CSA57_11220 [candidate division KSB3 bacterium]